MAVVLSFLNFSTTPPSARTLRSISRVYTEEEALENANIVRTWRDAFRDQCDEPNGHPQFVEARILRMYQPPPPTRSTTSSKHYTIIRRNNTDHSVEACRHVLLEFGVDKGETVGHFVQSAVPTCPKHQVGFPVYSLDEGYIELYSQEVEQNPVVSWFHGRMKQLRDQGRRRLIPPRGGEKVKSLKDAARTVGPEDYCVYGTETNPVRIERLARMQQRVMLTNPRPVRRLEFWFDTVLSSFDGPVAPTPQRDNPYYQQMSSSSSSSGVRHTNHTLDGRTLSSILRDTVQTGPDKLGGGGGHAMIVLREDVFGSLVEAAPTICQLAQQHSVQVDLLVDLRQEHNATDYAMYEREGIRELLATCGVHLFQTDKNPPHTIRRATLPSNR